LWDRKTGKLKKTFYAGSKQISSLDISPDEKFLTSASSGPQGTIEIWPITSDNFSFAEQANKVLPYDLGFAPQGDIFYYTLMEESKSSRKETVHIANRNTPLSALERVSSFEWESVSPFFKFSQDNQLILGSFYPEHTPIIWESNTGKKLRVFPKLDSEIKELGFFDKDSKIWVRTSVKVIVYDVSSTDFVWETESKASDISLDGKKIAVIKKNGNLEVLNSYTGTTLVSFPSQKNAKKIQFSPAGNHIATFNPNGYKKPRTASFKKGYEASSTPRFSHRSENVERRKDNNGGGTRIWNIETQSLEFSVPAPQNTISHLINFSPVGNSVIVPWGNGKLKMYNVDDKTETYQKGATSLKLSPDGMFAISNLNSVEIFDFETGTQVLSINGNMADINKKQTLLLTTYKDEIVLFKIPYFISAATRDIHKARILNSSETGQPLSKVEFQKIKKDRRSRIFSMAAKVVAYCLTPDERKAHNLTPDPPCWCQEKSYPPMKVWEKDYSSRNQGLIEKDMTKSSVKPNPFTHERSDGWTCPLKGTGSSAPWNEHEDIKALTSWEILGSAEEGYSRLNDLRGKE